MSEGDELQCLNVFPKEYLIIVYYILRAWWIQLMDVLVHYFICTGVIEQVLVMNNNLMTLVYTNDGPPQL